MMSGQDQDKVVSLDSKWKVLGSGNNLVFILSSKECATTPTVHK